MNKIFTALLRTALAGVVLASAIDTANAQFGPRSVGTYFNKRSNGKNVSLFHRSEIGYGLTFGNGSVSSVERYYDPIHPNIISGTSNTQNFSYRSMCGWANTYFPATVLGSRSILAINVGVFVNNNIFTINNYSYGGATANSIEVADGFGGFPIGVDYIFGGEATNNKADKITLRGGIGAMPFINFGGMADNTNTYFRLGVRPYVKAELGFFAGIEWKIKTQIVVGSRNIYDLKSGDYDLQDGSNYYSNFKMDLRPSYSVGIALMPFSFGWDNDNW